MSVDDLLGPDRQGFARLDARDLAVLGRYLFGGRWKAALARELAVSDRLVKYWASAQRPTSVRCSAMILALVQRRHEGRQAAVQQGYAAMVEALCAPVRPQLSQPLSQLRDPPVANLGDVARLGDTLLPRETVAADYERLGLVVLAARLRLPAIIVALVFGLAELAKLVV